jgi:hypothetical protein
MRKFDQIRKKLLLILVSGILILSAGFIFINCGKDAQLKVAITDKGQFAVDLSVAPGPGSALFGVNHHFPSIAGQEFTAEAWIKSRTSNLNGGIFGRFDEKGFVIYVKDNELKFAIRRVPAPATGTPLQCVAIGITSTECIVGSNVSVDEDVWTHVAGVLTKEDQSAGPNNCGVVGSEQPHMAIYVNGVLRDCGTTEALFSDDSDGFDLVHMGTISETGTITPLEGVKPTAEFEGVIDEVRLWYVARTQAQIQACKDQELNFHVKGDCYIDPLILKGYWRLNEGEGVDITDFSGGGVSGTIESPPGEFWSGGWTDGAPLVRDTD